MAGCGTLCCDWPLPRLVGGAGRKPLAHAAVCVCHFFTKFACPVAAHGPIRWSVLLAVVCPCLLFCSLLLLVFFSCLSSLFFPFLSSICLPACLVFLLLVSLFVCLSPFSSSRPSLVLSVCTFVSLSFFLVVPSSCFLSVSFLARLGVSSPVLSSRVFLPRLSWLQSCSRLLVAFSVLLSVFPSSVLSPVFLPLLSSRVHACLGRGGGRFEP